MGSAARSVGAVCGSWGGVSVTQAKSKGLRTLPTTPGQSVGLAGTVRSSSAPDLAAVPSAPVEMGRDVLWQGRKQRPCTGQPRSQDSEPRKDRQSPQKQAKDLSWGSGSDPAQV